MKAGAPNGSASSGFHRAIRNVIPASRTRIRAPLTDILPSPALQLIVATTRLRSS